MLGRSVPVFVLIGVACLSAQVPAALAAYQDQYYAGMRALKDGRYTEARPLLQAAYDGARTPSEDVMWKGRTAFGLGSLTRSTGNSVLAEKLQREAISLLQSDGEPSPLLGLALNGLGEALLEQAKFDEAEQVTTKALRILEHEPTLKDWAFLCRRHLAESRLMQQDFAGAEKLLTALVADERRETTAPDLPAALSDLGRVYAVQNRWKEAETLLRESVDRNLPLGELSGALADARVTLATLYRVSGHNERALPLLRKALKTYETIGDPHSASVYVQLGWCAFAEHKYMVAHDYLQKAVDVAGEASLSEALVSKLKEELATVGPAFATAGRSRR